MIAFTKTALPFGWLGNMSAHPVTHQGKVFRTAEALFQALRFNDPDIIEQIRAAKSPMGAKMVAKRNKGKMVVAPGSAEDVKNMEAVLRLKVRLDDLQAEPLFGGRPGAAAKRLHERARAIRARHSRRRTGTGTTAPAPR